MKTELELLWLPSHMIRHTVRLHEMADRHCALVRREGRPIFTVGGVEVPLSMEEGLVWELRDTFQRRGEAARRLKRAKRSRSRRGSELSDGRLSFWDRQEDEGERRVAKRRRVSGLV